MHFGIDFPVAPCAAIRAHELLGCAQIQQLFPVGGKQAIQRNKGADAAVGFMGRIAAGAESNQMSRGGQSASFRAASENQQSMLAAEVVAAREGQHRRENRTWGTGETIGDLELDLFGRSE